jgi:hypothetical protein
LIVSGSVGKMAYARCSRSALTERAGCATEAFGVTAPKAFILSSPDGAPHRPTLPTAARAFISFLLSPAPDRFLLPIFLKLVFLKLDFENHFQEIGIIRRALIVVNHFLLEI